MRKIQFGCGGNRIAGWENYDMEIDITEKLPFDSNSVSHVFAEHVVEHVTIHQAWNFFEECHRILCVGGLIKIAVPCVSQIYKYANQNYLNFVEKNGWGKATLKDAVKSIIFNHGHLTVWEQSSLDVIMSVIGFQKSIPVWAEMADLRNHHKVIGKEIDDIETIVFDGMKV